MSLRIPRVSHEPSDILASLCKAAGDPLRLNILRALSNDSFGVLELTQVFAIGQSGMSHHLKVLAQAGLVATRREGNAIFYRRALPSPACPSGALHSVLLDTLEAVELAPDIQQRITAVHAQRRAASEEFFTRQAGSFQKRQDLIAGLPQYRDSLLAFLEALQIPHSAHVLEVGPGEGRLLPDLAARFAQVTAIDSSSAMLERARQHCREQGCDNVAFMLGDVLQASCPPTDCLILNMVLHHLAAPGEALQQLADLLHPKGSLLITELCQHQQSWAREVCGDLWLGFEQEELARWASSAGLIPGETLYIGLKNGFQIQIRHFAKPDLEHQGTTDTLGINQ